MTKKVIAVVMRVGLQLVWRTASLLMVSLLAACERSPNSGLGRWQLSVRSSFSYIVFIRS